MRWFNVTFTTTGVIVNPHAIVVYLGNEAGTLHRCAAAGRRIPEGDDRQQYCERKGQTNTLHLFLRRSRLWGGNSRGAGTLINRFSKVKKVFCRDIIRASLREIYGDLLIPLLVRIKSHNEKESDIRRQSVSPFSCFEHNESLRNRWSII